MPLPVNEDVLGVDIEGLKSPALFNSSAITR